MLLKKCTIYWIMSTFVFTCEATGTSSGQVLLQKGLVFNPHYLGTHQVSSHQTPLLVTHPCRSGNPTVSGYIKRTKSRDSDSNAIHGSQELLTIQMSTDGWMDKQKWSSHTTEYYSSFCKEGNSNTWMNLDDIILCKISWTLKDNTA